MFDSFRTWRKESQQRQKKREKEDLDKALMTNAQKAKECEEKVRERNIEELDRLHRMSTDKCYTASNTNENVKERDDSLVGSLLETPPPYAPIYPAYHQTAPDAPLPVPLVVLPDPTFPPPPPPMLITPSPVVKPRYPLRSQETREQATIYKQAMAWMSNEDQYTASTIWETMSQWTPIQQTNAFRRMARVLHNKYAEIGRTAPRALLRLMEQVKVGNIQGDEMYESVVTLVALRVAYYLRYQDSDSDTDLRRAYPLREVPPVWIPPVPGVNVGDAPIVAGHFQHMWVHVPWKRTDVLQLRAQLPDPRKNPAAYYKELDQIISPIILTLADIDMLFGTLVPPDLWTRIRRQDHVEFGGTWAAIERAESDRAGGAKPDPLVLDLPARIITMMKTMLSPHRINWDKLSACKQKKDKSVSDFFTRFEETCLDYSGQDITTEGGMRLFVDKFVNNLLPDLCQKLKTSESTWAVASPSSILTMVQYYENRKNEDEERTEEKQRSENQSTSATGLPCPSWIVGAPSSRRPATTPTLTSLFPPPLTDPFWDLVNVHIANRRAIGDRSVPSCPMDRQGRTRETTGEVEVGEDTDQDPFRRTTSPWFNTIDLMGHPETNGTTDSILMMITNWIVWEG